MMQTTKDGEENYTRPLFLAQPARKAKTCTQEARLGLVTHGCPQFLRSDSHSLTLFLFETLSLVVQPSGPYLMRTKG